MPDTVTTTTASIVSQTVPWPWPLAPAILILLAGVAAFVLLLIHRHVLQAKESRLPLFADSARQLLPVLALLGTGLIAAYLLTGRDYLWMLLPWATVTVIMLWPVGRRFKAPYLSYRTPLFILGVISMAYIPFTGFALGSQWPYPVKLSIFLFLPIDISLLGFLAGLQPAIGRPLPTFFRPDLLFGDGRVLVGGILSLVLGLRYFVGHPPPEGVPVPIPTWDWYAILFAVALGIIPLIPLRGMFKLLLRMRRLRDGTWGGWGATIVREGWLVASILAIGFGFHNVFKGWSPFVTSHHVLHGYTWVPLLGMAVGAFLLIGVRGALKRLTGDPFIVETVGQSVLKHLVLVLGVAVLMWSFMSIVDTELGDVKHAGYVPIESAERLHALEEAAGHGGGHEPARWPASGFIIPGIKGVIVGPWNWVGAALFLWGLTVLVPLRVLVQHYQRHAIVGQMAAVILPSQTPEHRERLVRKMMTEGLLTMPSKRRTGYMVSMNRALAEVGPELRAATTQSMLRILAELPQAQRNAMMEAQAAALGKLKPEHRVTRMADMMGAVSQLPEDQRRMMMEKMATMMA
ncbi:MAG: hypothetical protein HY685_00925 [Chloroflexi bacterium]|nr:hypothetical protein [Chloroflexota bacterium]